MKVSRQGYYQYLEGKQRPEKHAELLAEIQAILDEDEENDSYGRKRMIDALRLKGRTESDSTIYRVLRGHGLLQKPRTPRGLTVADKAAHKNDNLLRRDFTAQAPLYTIHLNSPKKSRSRPQKNHGEIPTLIT